MYKLAGSLVSLGLVSCGALPTNQSDTSKIIGSNDLVVVKPQGENLPKAMRPLIDAFGLMSMGCTGTHIGNGLVLSAGHCFDSKEFAEEICKTTTIQFGFRQGVNPYLETKCAEIVALELTDKKDFVVFRVADVPRAKVDVELKKSPKLRAAITIFGHPRERPLEWSQRCRLAKARDIEGTLADFTHQCDTEPASSGSVVISTSSLKIIGVHNGGVEPWNYGTLVSTTPELVEPLLKALPQTAAMLADAE